VEELSLLYSKQLKKEVDLSNDLKSSLKKERVGTSKLWKLQAEEEKCVQQVGQHALQAEQSKFMSELSTQEQNILVNSLNIANTTAKLFIDNVKKVLKIVNL